MGKSRERQIKDLTAAFKKLGAADPETWARSQVEEGIAQFPRFVFLKAAWQYIVREDNEKWIDAAIREFEKQPDAPFSGAGRALMRLIASGASRNDLTDLVKSMQAQTLMGVCELLDGAAAVPFLEDGMPDVSFLLVNVPAEGNGEPVEVAGLHESVLELDPSGREVRPRWNTTTEPA